MTHQAPWRNAPKVGTGALAADAPVLELSTRKHVRDDLCGGNFGSVSPTTGYSPVLSWSYGVVCLPTYCS